MRDTTYNTVPVSHNVERTFQITEVCTVLYELEYKRSTQTHDSLLVGIPIEHHDPKPHSPSATLVFLLNCCYRLTGSSVLIARFRATTPTPIQ